MYWPTMGPKAKKGRKMIRLLTVPQAAERLSVSVKTTWKFVYSRKVTVVRIGRSVRITEDSIDKLIDDGTTPADDDDDQE